MKPHTKACALNLQKFHGPSFFATKTPLFCGRLHGSLGGVFYWDSTTGIPYKYP